VAGWIAQTNRRQTALTQSRNFAPAAELEETMDKHARHARRGDAPRAKMLAEALALQNHPQDALAEYQAVLKSRAPTASTPLYGAANAAEAAGNRAGCQ